MRGHSRSPPAGAGGCRPRRRARAAAGSGGARRPAGAPPPAPDLDVPERLAHRERLPRLDGDRGQAARGGRRHLEVDLVGRDLHQVCSAATASPTATRHSTTMPSVTDSMSGRTMSTVPPAARGPRPRASGAVGAAAGARPSPSEPSPVLSSARSAPTSTVSPGCGHDPGHARRCGRRHLDVHLVGGDVQQRVAGRTASPSSTRHSTTTPSVTDSPSSGSTTLDGL